MTKVFHPKSEFKKGHSVSSKSIDALLKWVKENGNWMKGKHIQPNNALEIWRKNGGVVWNKGLKGGTNSGSYKKGHLGILLEKHYNWQGGKSFEPYTTDWTETLRRSIRERDNYICQNCSQYGNTVHHIDYNKKNCSPENLITLCHNCNIRANYNRKYWIGYFREIIMGRQR